MTSLVQRENTNRRHWRYHLPFDGGKHEPKRLPYRPLIGRDNGRDPSCLWHRAIRLEAVKKGSLVDCLPQVEL